MATNIIYHPGDAIPVTVSDPATPASGDPVRAGSMPGVALNDEESGGTTAVLFDCVADLNVNAVNQAGNSAVAVNDKIYYTDADTIKLSKKNTGYFFGIALEAISSGSSGTINVAVGKVSVPGIADQETTQKTGFIPLDLFSARAISSDDIGAVLDGTTAPELERVSTAGDQAARLKWLASSVDEVQFAPVPMPPDWDEDQNASVHILAAMAGGTDTPTIDIQVYDGTGDTEMGGATAALSSAVAEVSFALSSANLSGHPTGFLNVGVVPGAHTTDAAHLYAIWVEYTRK
jgi:predicted RecA/RadA family phage recombinase